MSGRFLACLGHVLVYEGGYSNHPADPGGATNRGVTQRVYDAYRCEQKRPRRSVRYLTQLELEDIYRFQYWTAVRGDELPAGVDLVVFDAAVNSGPVRAAKWLQRAVGTTADGVIGVVTLAQTHRTASELTIERVCEDRLDFLRRLKTWPTFGKGWRRRVAAVRRAARAAA